MSKEAVKAFFERARTDPDFARQIAACTDEKTCLAVAKAAGFEFSSEEFSEEKGNLSEKELERIVGGVFDSRVGTYGFGGNGGYGGNGGCGGNG